MKHSEIRDTRRATLKSVLAASILKNPLACACGASAQVAQFELRLRVRRTLPPLPDREGFAGMYAGVLGGKLVVAGGANFPNGYPWEGGRKIWYDDILVLDSPNAKSWTSSETRLFAPAGYGLSFSTADRLYFVGGESGTAFDGSHRDPRCLKTVISLVNENGNLVSRFEQPLPEPLKDACGVTVGKHFFLFGGLSSPSATTASNRLYVLDTSERDAIWRRAPDLPAEGRFQAVSGTDGRNLFIYSGIVAACGTDGTAIRRKPYLREVWRYTPGADVTEGRWTRLTDMPREAAAAPSPAIRTRSGHLLILSGACGADHSKPQIDHPGWSGNALLHDPSTDSWSIIRDLFEPGQSVVTAPSVFWKGSRHVVSGEIAPGRRTPALTTILFEE